MVSDIVVSRSELKLPTPLADGVEMQLSADIRRLVLDHVERNGYSWQQISYASNYEVWALKEAWQRESWQLALSTYLASVLGLPLKVIAAH